MIIGFDYNVLIFTEVLARMARIFPVVRFRSGARPDLSMPATTGPFPATGVHKNS